MKDEGKTMITVETTINAPLKQVWELWTNPEHIINWNFASEDWCCPSATNDLKPGGQFVYRMEAKDESFGFDFGGVYDRVEIEKLIVYKMEDGRMVEIIFTQEDDQVRLVESFEAEGINSDEKQRAGWQSILENFRNYVELNA